ncbi:MAG: enoyl-ACP reductase [Chloroflexi bacterium RBG_13_66_10]|nr:MAG: enoyl-ACP reductase [Chloroflexi bacterium RBG_13_66_10]
MKLLEGKTALIFGVANDHSIAWGIAEAMHAHGARLAFSYAGEALERRVRPLAASVDSSFVEPCDVTNDAQIEAVFSEAARRLGALHILVHAVAFANRDELTGPYYNTSREGFRMALDISVYSFTALARAAAPLMTEGGSMMTLTYYGGEKVVAHYNVMGVAKAALEASTRYLAADLGPRRIRVNAISAGPVRTLAAAGVAGFKRMHRQFAELAPMRRNITLEDVGGAAVWLASDLSSAVTGEVVFVDSGYNILGVPDLPEAPGAPPSG